jgi:hypothetical protein
VDSVIALFRVDFSGRGELAERQVFSSIHFNGSRQLVKMTLAYACIYLL